MSESSRYFLVWAYVLLVVVAPLMVIILPGEPALTVNRELLGLEAGHLLNPGIALGEGAEKYDENVLDGLAGNIASAAADYPDGSNAVLALFDKVTSARAALKRLNDMIPHLQEEQDLWATHFTSTNGEYVMLSQVERVVVMIIGEREAMARQRLAALPALNYNSNPGLGAILQQQSTTVFMLMLGFYVVVQWLFVRLLFSWAGLSLPMLSEKRNTSS